MKACKDPRHRTSRPFSPARFAGFFVGSMALHAAGVTALDAPAQVPQPKRPRPVQVQLLAPLPARPSPPPVQPAPPKQEPTSPEPPPPTPKATPPIPEPPETPAPPEPAPEPQPREPQPREPQPSHPEQTSPAPSKPAPSLEPAPSEPAPHLLATSNPYASAALPAGSGGSGLERTRRSYRRGPPVAAPKAAARPRAVPLSQLSRKPRPPSLDRLLRRNYPRRLRERGIGGEAIVRLRLSARGRVEHITILSESVSGFGRACRDTLEGTRWTPPLDERGRAVPTHLRYRCRFSVSG